MAQTYTATLWPNLVPGPVTIIPGLFRRRSAAEQKTVAIPAATSTAQTWTATAPPTKNASSVNSFTTQAAIYSLFKITDMNTVAVQNPVQIPSF